MSPWTKARIVTLAVLMAPSGCRACTLEEGERTYETRDGAVHLEVVREASRSTVIFSSVGFVLRVGTTPPFDEPLDQCVLVPRYDLGEDATGKLVAFRCNNANAEHWQLLRVSAGGAHARDCSVDLGLASKPDFSLARPIADAAAGIARCHRDGHGTNSRPLPDVYVALADLVREGGGAAAVQKLFAETSDDAFEPRALASASAAEDSWTVAASRLPTAERAAVHNDVCAALLDPAKDTAYVRAARLCPLVDPPVGDAALERVRAAFAGKPISLLSAPPAPLEWAAPIATHHHPKETGEAACAFLTAGSSPNDRRMDLALLAIAASGTKCPAVRTMSPPPCSDWLDCDGGICSPHEVAGMLDGWRKLDAPLDDAGVRARTLPRPPHDPALVAIYALGPLPRDVALRNARRHYSVDPGECHTTLFDTHLCNLPLDGGRLVIDQCSFRADDKRKEVSGVADACDPADGGCE